MLQYLVKLRLQLRLQEPVEHSSRWTPPKWNCISSWPNRFYMNGCLLGGNVIRPTTNIGLLTLRVNVSKQILRILLTNNFHYLSHNVALYNERLFSFEWVLVIFFIKWAIPLVDHQFTILISFQADDELIVYGCNG